MAGFIQDPIQFVNLIADNLRDRYQTGFPVLKELIQNTDDAPASELHYGLSSGLPNAMHPLLKGSGLFLINNGEFKSSDARGIRSFGQNSFSHSSSPEMRQSRCTCMMPPNWPSAAPGPGWAVGRMGSDDLNI